MKRFLLYSFIGFFSFAAKAQTNTWIGGASGDWSSNGNWSLGHAPATGEDVVINTNSSINVNTFIAGARTISSLKITGGVTVRLTCSVAATRYLRLSGTSTTTKGLQVDAGNILIFDATNTTGTGNWICDLTGSAGVTGSIDGELQFEGNGAATGAAALRLYSGASNNADLVVSGKIIHLANTGDDIAGSGAYLTMQPASVYELHDDGGLIPNGTWSNSSYVKLITTGTNPPLFSGNSYGNLEVNCSNITIPLSFNKDISFNDVNLISTGASMVRVKTGNAPTAYNLTINGNLTISPSSKLEVSGNTDFGDPGAIIHAKGNIINSGMISESGNNNHFELSGTTNQNISGSGEWVGSHLDLVMNNPAGATLISPLVLKCDLALTNGKIRTDATNILTMSRTPDFSSNWSGGSSASFVEGPMRRVTTGTHFKFPVGKGNVFAPIMYESTLNYFMTDTFSAEYFRINPQAVYGHNYDPAGNPEIIHHVSNVEYWSLVRTAGSTPGTRVVLTATANSFCTDSNLDSTFAARYNTGASQWTTCSTLSREDISTSPPFVLGDIRTYAVPDFGIFTFATSSPANSLGDAAESPLPIHLVTFDATKLSSSSSLVSWQLADLSSPGEKFGIQRAGKAKDFITIGTVTGSETDHFYNYTDNDLKTGVNFYRLKMTDKDGKITYSRTVAVMNDVNGLLLTSLMPTVVNSTATLTVTSSGRQKLDIVIVDMNGRIVQKQNYTVVAGNTGVELEMARLAAGVYQLVGFTAEGKTNAIRFIKQ